MSKDQLLTLVQKSQNKDTKSFSKLYDLLIDKVYRFFYFRTGKKEEAQDLTSTLFLKVWEKLDTYTYNGIPFEAWVFRIARNQLIDYYRTHKESTQIEEAFDLEEQTDSVEDIVERNLSYQQVLEGLRKLPASYQEIIILKFIEEKDNHEISNILEKDVSYIRVLQSRALKALKKVLQNNENK